MRRGSWEKVDAADRNHTRGDNAYGWYRGNGLVS